MAREKLVAKYQGESGQFIHGIPDRDLYESDWAVLSDDQKALLATDPPEGIKPLYQLRHDAPAEAEMAATRVERAAAPSVRAESEPVVTSQPAPTPPATPKEEAKK